MTGGEVLPPPMGGLTPSAASACHATEARYRTLVETAHDGVFVCDEETRLVLVNPAFAAICGRPAHDLVGRSVAEVIAPEELAAAPLRRAALEQAGRIQTQRTILRPDGTRAHVEVGVTRLAHGEIQGVVHDVTERRRMEDELRERERRFRGIFDAAFQFVGLLAPEGTVREANRTALEFAGLRAEDVVGRPFWDTPWWAHSGSVQQRLRDAVAAAAGGEFVRFETEHVGADGRAIAVDFSLTPVRDADGRVTLLIAEGRDVTDGRRVAALLRESEESFRSAFEHSGIGMALVALDGRWRRVNRALCEIVGYDETALLSATFQDITHPDDIAVDLGLAQELLDGTRDWYQLEKRYLRRDGRVVWVLLNGSLVRNGDGTPRYFVAQIQDVTARKEADAALERHRAELAHSNAELARSNAELEQFAYVASHDLQEPLRAVASYTQLLADRYRGQLDERADRWVEYAVDGARRMQALISDLLALSRVGTRAIELAPVDLDAVLATTRRVLEPSIAGSGAEITAGPLPTVLGDALQLGQLLQNLLGNANKFCRPGTPPRVHVSATLDGAEWVISVRDDGIGIEPRFADRIFVIFKRLHTRDEYPGTGIGLAICKKIVERHGGRIWAEPAEGGGTVFRFTLPRAGPETAPDEVSA